MARGPLGVVLTAGLGTRLRPITPATPKPLVPLLNRPLIVYALELLASLGLREIAVVVGPEDATTAEVARSHAPPGVTVSEAVQREPNGPGDAVASVGAALEERTVAVLAVDTVLRGADPALLRHFEDSGATAGLLLQAVDDPRAFGVALLEGERIVDLEEKPEQPRSNLALVGLWLLAPEAVERVRTNPYINAKGESDLTATVAALLGEGRELRGWTLDGEWLDGGTLEGLLHAQSRLLPGIEADSGSGSASALADGGNQISGAVLAAEGARVRESRIAGPALIGARATVEGCSLAETVVGANAVIEDAELIRALVEPGARLRGGSYADVVVTAAGEVAGPGLAGG